MACGYYQCDPVDPAAMLAITVIWSVILLAWVGGANRNARTGLLAVIIPAVAVLINLLVHKFFFEPFYQPLIATGIFGVEGFFYYASSFIVISIPYALFTAYDPATGGLGKAVACAISGTILYSIFYYIIRPLPPIDFALWLAAAGLLAPILAGVLLLDPLRARTG